MNAHLFVVHERRHLFQAIRTLDHVQVVCSLTLPASSRSVSALQGQGLLSEAAQWGKLLATVPEDIRETLDSRWQVGLSLL